MRGNPRFDEAAGLLAGSRRPVVFTGSGMSKESGIRTFRGEDGYWREHRAEDLATPGALRRNPALVWEWYRERLIAGEGIEPHAGYMALTELQERKGSMPVITQNVDGLHQKAGHREVVELHGTLLTASCMEGCGNRVRLRPEMLRDLPPACPCGSWLRPDVVLFGEALPFEAFDRALALAGSCDLMLVVGTSMVVYPAAGIPGSAIRSGARVVEINPEETDFTGTPGVISLRGSAGEILPELIGATT